MRRVIALLREAEDDHELRREPAGGRDGAEPAFEARELLSNAEIVGLLMRV